MPTVVWADGKKILKVRDYSPVESFDPAVHSGVPEEGVIHAINNKLIRITSYNVCYTKLLRSTGE